MAIAPNYRKYPQAMALQLVLKFGRPVWNGARPGTLHGRKMRAHVTAAMRARDWIVYPVKPAIAQWWKDAQAKAKAFAKAAKKCQQKFDLVERITEAMLQKRSPQQQQALRAKINQGLVTLVV